MLPDFIIVDDDPINNMLCQLIIEQEFSKASVQSFTDPCIALAYIESTYANAHAPDAILFLDINMPALSGWEFLDAFELFAPAIKKRLKIYMLSSSVDPTDKERADRNANVLSYIEKPLTTKSVDYVFSQV
jgi:CheY-like chemotaxis protein